MFVADKVGIHDSLSLYTHYFRHAMVYATCNGLIIILITIHSSQDNGLEGAMIAFIDSQFKPVMST